MVSHFLPKFKHAKVSINGLSKYLLISPINRHHAVVSSLFIQAFIQNIERKEPRRITIDTCSKLDKINDVSHFQIKLQNSQIPRVFQKPLGVLLLNFYSFSSSIWYRRHCWSIIVEGQRNPILLLVDLLLLEFSAGIQNRTH